MRCDSSVNGGIQVPSKLLIQVPRFGKKFQTFQKIIPAKSLNVAESIDAEKPAGEYIFLGHLFAFVYLLLICMNEGECYNCQERAYKICHQCTSDYGGEVAPTFCDKCLENVHKKLRRDHQWDWCDQFKQLRQLAEFELLSVICIETSHYVCFARHEDRWIFFDSMANRLCKYLTAKQRINEEHHPAKRLQECPQRA